MCVACNNQHGYLALQFECFLEFFTNFRKFILTCIKSFTTASLLFYAIGIAYLCPCFAYITCQVMIFVRSHVSLSHLPPTPSLTIVPEIFIDGTQCWDDAAADVKTYKRCVSGKCLVTYMYFIKCKRVYVHSGVGVHIGWYDLIWSGNSSSKLWNPLPKY